MGWQAIIGPMLSAVAGAAASSAMAPDQFGQGMDMGQMPQPNIPQQSNIANGGLDGMAQIQPQDTQQQLDPVLIEEALNSNPDLMALLMQNRGFEQTPQLLR